MTIEMEQNTQWNVKENHGNEAIPEGELARG